MATSHVHGNADGGVTTSSEGSISTGSDATAGDPVETTVTVPAGAASQNATTTISESAPGAPPGGFTLLGQQVNIGVTPGTTFSSPITIVFEVDSSLLTGIDPNSRSRCSGTV